jgi:hypothetical protein
MGVPGWDRLVEGHYPDFLIIPSERVLRYGDTGANGLGLNCPSEGALAGLFHELVVTEEAEEGQVPIP